MTRKAALLALLLAACGMSGCATVSSSFDTSYTDSHPGGVTYFMPMRLVRFTATREPTTVVELLGKRDAKVAALSAARAAAAAARARREQAEAVLNALPATSDLRAPQGRIVELARAEEAVLAGPVQTLTTELASATAAVLSAQSSGVACTFSASVELLPVQADRSARFVAEPRHNVLRDDTAKFAVNPAGLLTSANVVAVDQTAQIIVEIASAAAGAPASGEVKRDANGVPETPDCTGPRRFSSVFDPTVNTDISDLNDALKKAAYPFNIDATMSGVAVTDGGASNLPDASTRAGGLFYRSPTPVVIVVKQTRDYNAWQPIDAVVMSLPQAGPVSFIPMEANALVKTTHDVVFVDGSIASWNSERPSELLSLARVPLQVVDSVFTSVSKIVQARINLGTQSLSLADQQRLIIESQARDARLMQCLSLAQRDGTDTAACFVEEE